MFGFNTKLLLSAVAGLAMAGVAVGEAAATPVQITTTGSNAFGTPDWSRSGQISGVSGTVGAGPFRVTAEGFGDILAFCVDIENTLKLPGTYDVAPDLFAGAVLGNLTRLVQSAWDLVGTGATQAANRDLGAAFQLATWEVINEGSGSLDIKGGTFEATGFTTAALNQANTWLSSLDDADLRDNGLRPVFFRANTPSDSQHLMTVAPIPLPAAAWMLLSALGGLVVMRRRARA